MTSMSKTALIRRIFKLVDERTLLRERINTLEVEIKVARGQRDAAHRLNIVQGTVEKDS